MRSPQLRWRVAAAAMGAAFAADVVTKMLVLARFSLEGQSVVVIPGFLAFTYRRNPGMAFSMLHDYAYAPVILSLVALAALLFIASILYRTPALPLKVAAGLGCIAAGAAGNLIDRIRHPHTVVDFIDCYIGTRHWPAFNIADSVIFVGAGLLVISSFTDPQAFPSRPQNPSTDPSGSPR